MALTRGLQSSLEAPLPCPWAIQEWSEGVVWLRGGARVAPATQCFLQTGTRLRVFFPPLKWPLFQLTDINWIDLLLKRQMHGMLCRWAHLLTCHLLLFSSSCFRMLKWGASMTSICPETRSGFTTWKSEDGTILARPLKKFRTPQDTYPLGRTLE